MYTLSFYIRGTSVPKNLGVVDLLSQTVIDNLISWVFSWNNNTTPYTHLV